MNLIPGVSTHFRYLSYRGNNPVDLTLGKVYEIIEWKGSIFSFRDDVEDIRTWTEDLDVELAVRYRNSGNVSCVTFERLLEKILQ